jgi:Domain of Unknown Function (DUF1080)
MLLPTRRHKGEQSMRRILLLLALLVALPVASVALADKDAAKDNTPPEGFTALFNGKDLTGWKVNDGGKMSVWGAEKGLLYVEGDGGGWLMTEKEYGDFEIRVEFKLPKAGNSGVGLRSPMKGDPAYVGMEIQILDDESPEYKNLKPFQYTGSIYGVVAPSTRATKSAGDWQAMRIVAKGRQVMVEVNGTKVVDANLDDHKDKNKEHPGLTREKGHLGLQSHTGRVEFRNVFVKSL